MMNPYISIFEIPVTDMARAKAFYEALLGINIETMEMPGMELGIFPYENQVVTGLLVKDENSTPSHQGVTIYFTAEESIDAMLEKIESLGGSIILPKTPHADENGFFALFSDTEGNRLGLNGTK